MFQALGKAWQVGKSILHSNEPINYIKGMIDKEIMNTWRAESLGLRGAKGTGDAAAADSKALSVYNPQDSQLNREITNWDRGRALFMNNEGKYTPLSKGGAITGATGGTGIAGSYLMFGD